MILASHGIIGSQIVQFAGLLDTYTGAAAAYSLRLLRSAYTGYAIKVRRASDNTEQDIGFSNNELDTTTLASFCSGTNGFVTTWYDQSGNGNNATQTTAANQPKIYDSSTGVITENGKAAVQFDGTDDSMNHTQVITGTTARSLFFVNKQSSSGGVGDRGLYTANLGVTNNGEAYRITKESASLVLRVQGSSTFSYPSGQSATSYSLLSNFWASGGSQDAAYFMNSVSAAYSSGTSVNLNTANIGTSVIGYYDASPKYFVGTMQEVVIYTSNQSSNRTGIETNINGFYSIY